MIFKSFGLLLCPFTYALRKIYRMDAIKNEAIRVINGLVDEPTYDARDYRVKFHLLDGFSFCHRTTGLVLASVQTKYQQVNFKNLQTRTKFFPTDFARDNSGRLKFSEGLAFWYSNGGATTVISEIKVDPDYSLERNRNLDACPYHNVISIRMDCRLEVAAIEKEVWDTSEMYGYTIEEKSYPVNTPLSQIFVISNKFINERHEKICQSASD